MCEMLVRVNDKVNSDFYLNCQCMKRGDIVTAQADGWNWGMKELANPDWRIIKLPGLPLTNVLGLLSPELPVDPNNPSKTLQKRGFKFDVDRITTVQSVAADAVVATSITSYLADAARKTPAVAISQLSASDIAILIVQKPPIADVAIIGNSTPNVIG